MFKKLFLLFKRFLIYLVNKIDNRPDKSNFDPKEVVKEIVKTQQPTGTQKLLEFQKELQENATEAEKIFYKYLEDHRVKFEFQKILCPNKCYIVDFFLIDYQIIVEIDGGYHDTEEQQKKDWERSLEIYRKFGYKTFRLKNSQIFSGNYEKKLINFLKKIKDDNDR